MSDNLKNNLIRLIQNSPCACINITEFTLFLKDEDLRKMLDPVTSKDILITGLYGFIGTSKIYVSRSVQPGYIKLSELEYPNPNLKAGWSIQLDLNSSEEELNRMMELIAFW